MVLFSVFDCKASRWATCALSLFGVVVWLFGGCECATVYSILHPYRFVYHYYTWCFIMHRIAKNCRRNLLLYKDLQSVFLA